MFSLFCVILFSLKILLVPLLCALGKVLSIFTSVLSFFPSCAKQIQQKHEIGDENIFLPS